MRLSERRYCNLDSLLATANHVRRVCFNKIAHALSGDSVFRTPDLVVTPTSVTHYQSTYSSSCFHFVVVNSPRWRRFDARTSAQSFVRRSNSSGPRESRPTLCLSGGIEELLRYRILEGANSWCCDAWNSDVLLLLLKSTAGSPGNFLPCSAKKDTLHSLITCHLTR